MPTQDKNVKKEKEEDCDDSLVFRDEKTYDKMSKHLSDPEDIITEEDIRNVKTDVTPNTVNKPCDEESVSPAAEKEEKEENNNDSNSGGAATGDIQTPWSILK